MAGTAVVSPDPDGVRSKMTDSHDELPTDPDTGQRPLHLRVGALFCVLVGGTLGTAARYVWETLVPTPEGAWPWATFSVNLLGALLLGALLEALVRAGGDSGWRQRVRLLAGTGLCGAFTTYSTLALEVSRLGSAGHADTAVAYGLVSVLGGVLMAWLGIIVAASVHRRRART